MMKLTKVALATLVVFPSLTFAQGQIVYLVNDIRFLIDTLITIVAALALLVFFWGLVKFIYNASAEGKSEGKNFMIWGVIALFVMVSVWGLVRFIGGELGVNVNEPAPQVPTFRR